MECSILAPQRGSMTHQARSTTTLRSFRLMLVCRACSVNTPDAIWSVEIITLRLLRLNKELVKRWRGCDDIPAGLLLFVCLCARAAASPTPCCRPQYFTHIHTHTHSTADRYIIIFNQYNYICMLFIVAMENILPKHLDIGITGLNTTAHVEV